MFSFVRTTGSVMLNCNTGKNILMLSAFTILIIWFIFDTDVWTLPARQFRLTRRASSVMIKTGSCLLHIHIFN